MAHEQISTGVSLGMTGFKFGGPIGGIIGFGVGTILGSSARAKRKKEEKRLITEATKQSFLTAEQGTGLFNQTQATILKDYKMGVATATSRYAAGGGDIKSDAFTRIKGGFAKQRDTSLVRIQDELDTLKGGESFKFIRQEFDRMGGVQSDYEENGKFSINAEGYTGESFFTDAQKKDLRTIDRGRSGGIFAQYAQQLRPSFEEYSRGRFGNEEDKARFESDMDTRIQNANARLDERILQQDLETARRERDITF